MRAACASLLFPRPTFVGSPFVELFNGENMPLAAGEIRAACWSPPSKDCNRLRETVLFQRSLAIFSAMDWTLTSDSPTVLSAPFNMNPRISFSVLNL
jgi:hypothetical protein